LLLQWARFKTVRIFFFYSKPLVLSHHRKSFVHVRLEIFMETENHKGRQNWNKRCLNWGHWDHTHEAQHLTAVIYVDSRAKTPGFSWQLHHYQQ
jgi:hypothetical protein